MPGGGMLKRAWATVPLIAAAILVTGCAGDDHSWRGEFDARLGGSPPAIEGALMAMHPQMTESEYFETFTPLGKTLLFKASLIDELNPPSGCDKAQQKAKHD